MQRKRRAIGRKTTAISFEGDRNDVRVVADVARRKGQSTGAYIRTLVIKDIGLSTWEEEAKFFSQGGSSTVQFDSEPPRNE